MSTDGMRGPTITSQGDSEVAGTEAEPARLVKDCPWCGEALTVEEMESPMGDQHPDELVCDECYRMECQFVCCLCGNLEDIEYGGEIIQHAFAVVAPDSDLSVGTGIYKVNRFPYYGGSMLGPADLFASSLEFVSDLGAWSFDFNGYCVGHLCNACQKRILGALQEKRARGER